MNKSGLASMGILLSAFFWGTSGILTQIGLVETTPMQLIAIRFIVAAMVAGVFLKPNLKSLSSKSMITGLVLSALLTVMYVTSTIGLKYTSASNAGFIIGAAVVFVPIINQLLFKAKGKPKEYVAAVICLIGLGLVTLAGSTPLNYGDLLCFGDTIAYALFIIYSSRISESEDLNLLGFIQYVLVALFSGTYSLLVEGPVLSIGLESMLVLLTLGVFCTFVAFQVQLRAQQHISAEKAGRLLTFIPIFTVLVDFLVFKTQLSPAAMLGGALIIMATVLGDLDFKHVFASLSGTVAEG
ncbi:MULTISPECIES: DMT family transporter [unclassified Fusibacter]|uniref:DMT family transporter n=1 Tax=unclassified Fusibacter TaxID=2624464 RepID=UPI00101279BB|nr:MULTISPECIES: DMT family transporter [unclassified Fusibacter]MCK8060729.1 DMT family transporter [Fusibacter sp. A2]NPE23024.1 EamA family transporter [Fusibacter sp. A1]RXV59698.1 hypothetical protein DWB64_14370 [Fusibacter sp. A1]